MTGVITTGNHPKALWPGMHAFFGVTYNEKPKQWKEIFDVEKSTKNYEEDTLVTGFGLAPEKAQGASISYDSHTQGYTKRYTHVVYGLGYIVTREEEEDNLYESVSKKRIRGLAFSHRQTEEIVHANILNRGFNSSFVGGDAKELLATDHPTVNGSQSNELAVAADFSEASLEDLLIQVRQAKDDRGNRIALRAVKLIVPNNLMFEAQRVTKSELRSGTSNNDINAVRSMGLIPEGIAVNDYLTDADAWFLKTDCPNGMMHFDRRALEFKTDSDFDTENMKAKATRRYSTGWTDWRAMFGSPGA
jgi:phage major head subunit gpT-like protein